MRSARTVLAVALWGASHALDRLAMMVCPPGGLLDGTEVFDIGPDIDAMVEQAFYVLTIDDYERAFGGRPGEYRADRCPDYVPDWLEDDE